MSDLSQSLIVSFEEGGEKVVEDGKRGSVTVRRKEKCDEVKLVRDAGSKRRRFYGIWGGTSFNGGSYKKARRPFAWTFVGECFAKSWERRDGARGSGARTYKTRPCQFGSFISPLTELEFLSGLRELAFPF